MAWSLTPDVCIFSLGDCPDLSGMDEYTRSCLIAAYKFGTFNGMTPGEIYTEWEDGGGPPQPTPCLVCRSTKHWCALILGRNSATSLCFFSPVSLFHVVSTDTTHLTGVLLDHPPHGSISCILSVALIYL